MSLALAKDFKRDGQRFFTSHLTLRRALRLQCEARTHRCIASGKKHPPRNGATP